MTATPARRKALSVISSVRTRDAWVRPVLDAELASAELDPRDANLVRTLAIGVVQMQGSLDVAIDRFARSPSAIEPRVRDALHLSAYEILFMRTPAHVAVDQGVELVRSVTERAAGLANAVLRRIAEEADAFPWEDPDTTAGRALLTGHPTWFAERLVAELGADDAFDVLDADNHPAPLYLAVDLLHGTEQNALEELQTSGARPEEVDPPGCIQAGDAAVAVRSEPLRDGRTYVSDAAAQQVAQLAGSAGGRVVEIGAGKGTKTLTMLSHALRSGTPLDIDSVDISPAKLDTLSQRVGPDASVTTHTIDVVADPDHLGALVGADGVFIDAPCSNTGTLRRHPERRWSLAPEDVAARAADALAMLVSAAPLVRPGGSLLYSTCSILAEENRHVIAHFLEAAAGTAFDIESLADDVSPGFARWVDGEGALQTLPTVDGPDGHFAVRLRRGG